MQTFLCSTGIAKYCDFNRNVNDFFTKDFPTGLIKIEARSLGRLRVGAKPSDSFTDEFKLIASRDLQTGAIGTEVKNTSSFTIVKNRLGTFCSVDRVIVCRLQEPFYLYQCKFTDSTTNPKQSYH